MTAKEIKAIRTRLALKQVDLAEVLKVSRGTVGMWETGQRNPIGLHLEVLERIRDKLAEEDRSERWQTGLVLALSFGTVALLSYLYDEPPQTD